jgi:hypothetical protein
MRQYAFVLPFAMTAGVLGVAAQVAALWTGHAVDVSDWLSSLHAVTEDYELDEILIAVGALAVAVVFKAIWNRIERQKQQIESERQKLEISNRRLLNRTIEFDQRNAVLQQTQAHLEERERLAWAVVTAVRRRLVEPMGGIVRTLESARRESISGIRSIDDLARAEAEARRILELVRSLPELGEPSTTRG